MLAFPLASRAVLDTHGALVKDLGSYNPENWTVGFPLSAPLRVQS